MVSNPRLHPAAWAVIPLALIVLAACVGSALPALGLSPTGPALTAPAQTANQDAPTATESAPQDDLGTSRIPARDRYDLAARFEGITNAKPNIRPSGPPKVGDEDTFWVDNTTNQQVSQVRAKLVYSGDHVAVWIEDGLDYDLDAVTRSAQRFDRQTYPTDRSFFGSEPLPGIDGDPRVNILNNDRMGSDAAGFFYSPSEYPASIVPDSNEREIFYMNWNAVRPGSAQYDAILAHEFQHMIHWNVDRNEDTWVNEGMSELAIYLNGFGTSTFAPYFMRAPDTQLNAWDLTGSNATHYGAAFLFNAYFLDRFGQDALRALVQNPDNGLQGFDTTLAGLKTGLTADGLFKDWVIANLLNDPTIGAGHYGYHNLRNLPALTLQHTVDHYPAIINDQTHQYGAQYIQLSGPASLKVHFEGAAQTAYLPTQIGPVGLGSGPQDHVWWSDRADNSDMSLTREIDLTKVTSATLDFDLWYAIEDGWDYGYVEVSPNGGHSWQMLRTGASTSANPHANSYGPGYTGLSSDQPDAGSQGWLHQTASLGLFAGKKILLRFEVITDDALNLPGMALDNICIHDINWCDDAETETPGWDAEGFVRINNQVPQRYTVQVVIPANDGSLSVIPMPLDAANTGDLAVTVGARPVTLVIAGLTRYTTEPAPYRVDISQAGP